MRKLLVVALCALASLAVAADRELPYAKLHGAFSKVPNIPDGQYFRLMTAFGSNDPAVATKDIKLVIRSKAGDIPVPVAPDGAAKFPMREDLLKENPPVVTNVGPGKLQMRVELRIEAPPAQRFEYGLMVAMQDEYAAIIARQGVMMRMMAPDFEGLWISYAPGTAATATVEAAKPETFQADAQGRIRIPDRKAWRKENPSVQLSAPPQRIELAPED